MDSELETDIDKRWWSRVDAKTENEVKIFQGFISDAMKMIQDNHPRKEYLACEVDYIRAMGVKTMARQKAILEVMAEDINGTTPLSLDIYSHGPPRS